MADDGIHGTQSIPLSAVLQQVRVDLHRDSSVHDSAHTRQPISGAKADSEQDEGLPDQSDQNKHTMSFLHPRTRSHRPPGWTPDRGQGASDSVVLWKPTLHSIDLESLYVELPILLGACPILVPHAGYYHAARERKHRASLVETGRFGSVVIVAVGRLTWHGCV